MQAELSYNHLNTELQKYSSKGCLFTVLPKFKIRSEGEPVQAGDRIILSSHLAEGCFLAFSRGTFTGRKIFSR